MKKTNPESTRRTTYSSREMQSLHFCFGCSFFFIVNTIIVLNRRVCRDNIALKCQQWLIYSCSCCYYNPSPPPSFPQQEASAGNDKWNENETLAAEVTFANIQSKTAGRKLGNLEKKKRRKKKIAQSKPHRARWKMRLKRCAMQQCLEGTTQVHI